MNTLFVANYEGKSFATLDMAAINLHTGICEIMKNGAATTFVKREGGVEVMLPVRFRSVWICRRSPDVARRTIAGRRYGYYGFGRRA